MKLISLNTWGGRAGKEKLLEFFSRHKGVDIFCLQEIWSGGEHEIQGFDWAEGAVTQILTNIAEILTDHKVFFYPHYKDFFGLSIFVRNGLKIIEEGDIFVYKDRGDVLADSNKPANSPRNLQYLTIETPHGVRTILNFHGLWNGGGKTDAPERLIQSDNITKFIKELSNPHVLVGDFNLLPDTQSLKKLEDFGLRNLIKEHGITSTRSSYYTKPARFADYTLVSKDIKVNEFKVLPDEVSDHLAMYLDFE